MKAMAVAGANCHPFLELLGAKLQPQGPCHYSSLHTLPNRLWQEKLQRLGIPAHWQALHKCLC